jgi:hypothetical protein
MEEAGVSGENHRQSNDRQYNSLQKKDQKQYLRNTTKDEQHDPHKNPGAPEWYSSC